MKVECEVERVGGHPPEIQVTCLRCGHYTQSYGSGGASIRRCLALLHEECPNNENNFYTTTDDSDEDP